MSAVQAAILQNPPAHARYLTFQLAANASPAALRQAMGRLTASCDGEQVVVGIGPQLVQALGGAVPGLHEFEAPAGARAPIPADQGALWLWLRGSDRGELLQLSRRLRGELSQALVLEDVVDGFSHSVGDNGFGRDLTGYEDGTENPSGEAAVQTAVVADGGAGLAGSSMVAVQRWEHDLDAFDALNQPGCPHAQDHIIGRNALTNEELDDAPDSAHVKRTAQESFEPEAFVLRRSMPWVDGLRAGLVFVAFGRSFDAFEAQLRRMSGAEDGVLDGLFSISKPLSTRYFWCPPVRSGAAGVRIDLSALGC